jgi:hypothetical protein
MKYILKAGVVMLVELSEQEKMKIDEYIENIYKINNFSYNGKTYMLKEYITYNVNYDDNVWSFHIPRYDIRGFAEDKEEALQNLHEMFSVMYDGLINEPDEKLDICAQKLRDLFKSDVSNIRV